MDGKAICPECELRALQSQMTKERVEALAAKMAYTEGVSATEAVYRKRIDICTACPALVSGMMCSHCGSYVAFRARIAGAVCPYPGENRWNAV